MRFILTIFLSLFLVANLYGIKDNAGNNNQNKIFVKVTSGETGAPMEGVEIYVSSINQSFYTDTSGEFSITLDEAKTWLRFSYPEFSQKEIFVSDPGEIEIILQLKDGRSMDSYIPGYFGEVEKYKNAASDYITSRQSVVRNQVTPGLFIQGKLSGVSSVAISGMPGEDTEIKIRGLSSLFAGGKTMIIVDGMPYNYQIMNNDIIPGNFHNPLKGIDVNDIERIEVIKDGGSLYGMRGSNGVIHITTRQPESVSTRLSFSFLSGMSMQPDKLDVMNASEYKTYLINQLQNSGLSFSEITRQNPWISGNPSYYYYYNYNNETDWQDEIFRPARLNKFNIHLEGGDEIARFAVLLGYTNQQAVVENTGYQRFNFRLNSDIRVIEKLYLISNVGFSYHVSDLKYLSTDYTLNPISSALLKGPMYGPYLRDNLGNRITIFSDSDEFGFSNPAVIINRSIASGFESDFFTNLKLLYEPKRNIRLSNVISVRYDNIRNNSFIPDRGIADFEQGELYNEAAEGIHKNYGITNESKLEWIHQYEQIHFFNTQVGFRISTANEIYNTGTVYNTPTDEFRSLSSVSLIENTYINGFTKRVNYSELFLYNSYRFLDKYLIDIVFNFSAGSNTGPDADAMDLFGGKWGFFPSVHGAWIMSNEDFMNSVNLIDLLKVRLSYSRTGNDYYTLQSRYYYQSRTYGVYPGIVRTYLPNRELKWEDVDQVNLGLDGYLWNEKLRFGLDIYSRATTDLLTYRQIDDLGGFKYIWENNGKMNASGMDLNVEISPLKSEFNLSVGGNLSLSRSVVYLDHDIILDIPGGSVIVKDGESALSFYGLETAGIFINSDEALSSGLVNEEGMPLQGGDVRFVNYMNDNVIDENDRVVIGNLLPGFRAGGFISIRYHKLHFYALAEYCGGNNVFNYVRMRMESFSGFENQSRAAYYAWKNDLDETDIPRLAYGDPSGNSRFSDRWIEDGGFFRLREISISYDLPVTRMYNNLRVFISGQNLITLSDYLGYYPEFGYGTGSAYQSTDFGQIPVTPQVTIGLNVGF